LLNVWPDATFAAATANIATNVLESITTVFDVTAQRMYALVRSKRTIVCYSPTTEKINKNEEKSVTRENTNNSLMYVVKLRHRRKSGSTT
jgi:hypothetical protein